MKFDTKLTPLTNRVACSALNLSENTLDTALSRGRIRRSLVLQSPTETELRYFSTLDLIEFSLFRELVLSNRKFDDPNSVLDTARACCKVCQGQMRALENGKLTTDQMIKTFVDSMDRHWKLPTTVISKRGLNQKQKYAQNLLVRSLHNWKKVTTAVEKLLTSPK